LVTNSRLYSDTHFSHKVYSSRITCLTNPVPCFDT
jgi:hypothetical protein